jgi:gluconokinase
VHHLVVMGVSGTGKTTVGTELARRLGWTWIEGDAHHPPENVAKMASGVPLTDADRWPWLEALAALVAVHDSAGHSTVLGCSALRRAYRNVLRSDAPPGSVAFVQLVAPPEVLRARMEDREHFMPPALLNSQIATLEPLGPDENGVVVDVTAPVDEVVTRALEALDCFTGS